MSKYPKYVFNEDGAKFVKDEDAENALQGTYYESPAEVPGHEAPVGVDVAPENEGAQPVMDLLEPGHVERDRLEAEAKRIGLKVDKRWSDETLRRQIFEKASA